MAEEFLTTEVSDIDDLRMLAEAEGVTVEEVTSAGFEPVTTVSVILIGSALAIATVRRLLDERKGGQVVDLRPGASRTFYRTPDLQYGLVSVISSHDGATLRVLEPRGMFGQVLDALVSVVGGGAKTAADVTAGIADLMGNAVVADSSATGG